MKSYLRTVALTAVTLAFASSLVGTAFAQQPIAATKVGVVNVGQLFTKYWKAQSLKKELDAELKPLKEQADNIKDAMLKHKAWLEDKRNGGNLQQIEISKKALIDGNRALEDLDLKARTMVGKKQETQLVQLYKEVQGSVQTYAQQTGFHIVLGYGDPPQLDPFSFANVNRRMTAMDMGTQVVMQIAPGLDITADVVSRLNSTAPPGWTDQSAIPAQPVSRQ